MGVFHFQLHAQHQPTAPDIFHLGHSFQLFFEIRALFQNALQKPGIVYPAEHYPGPGTSDGVAAKCGALHTGLQNISQFFTHQAGTDGQPACQRFGRGHHIRLNIIPLISVERAGTAHACLHFVHHQQYIPLLTQLCQALYKVLSHRDDAAFALNHFQQHGAHGTIHQLFDSRQVSGLSVQEAFRQGQKVLVESLLTSGGQCCQGAPMEGIHQGYDLVGVPLFPILPGHLHSAFIGFRSGIAKKRFRHTGSLAQFFRQSCVLGAVIIIAHMLDFPRLLRHSGNPFRIAVAQGVHPDAGGEIDVFFPLHIPGTSVFAFY